MSRTPFVVPITASPTMLLRWSSAQLAAFATGMDDQQYVRVGCMPHGIKRIESWRSGTRGSRACYDDTFTAIGLRRRRSALVQTRGNGIAAAVYFCRWCDRW